MKNVRDWFYKYYREGCAPGTSDTLEDEHVICLRVDQVVRMLTEFKNLFH